MGKKAGYVVGWIFIESAFGCLVVYFMVVTNMLQSILHHIFGLSAEFAMSETCRRVILIILAIALTLPSLKRDLEDHRYCYLLGIVCMGLIILIIVCQTPQYVEYQKEKNAYVEDFL